MIHLRFDDITPNSNHQNLEKILAGLARLRISATFGVVPDNLDSKLMVSHYSTEIIQELSHTHKSEPCLAMHGHQHVYVNKEPGILRFPTKSEFASLPFDVQKEKLLIGISKLKDWDIKVDTFFAPSHSFCVETVRALKELDFKYILDGWGGFPYDYLDLTFLPQQMGGFRTFPFGVSCHCFHVDAWCNTRLNNFLQFIEVYQDKIISLSQYQQVEVHQIHHTIPKFAHWLGRKIKNV